MIRRQSRTFLLCKETGMQKWARMLVKTGKECVNPSAITSHMREDSDFWSLPPFNDLVLANTFGHHKASRRWTWKSPNGQYHSQINNILVRKRLQSGVNGARTRSFLGADTGSDHDLLMMTLHPHLIKIRKPKHTRLKFDFENLKDPYVLETIQAMIGGQFTPLTNMNNKHTDMDSIITTFNTAVTKTTSEVFSKHR